MQNDKTTLKDLSVFSSEQGGGLFALLDHTTSQMGREVLRKHILTPPDTIDALQQVQDVIKFLSLDLYLWPDSISNGTLVMLEKFFDSNEASTSAPGTLNLLFGNFFQKLFNKNEYFFTRFSLSHLSDFLKGCLQMVELLGKENAPGLLHAELQQMSESLGHRLVADLVNISTDTSFRQLAALSFKARREMKHTILGLMAAYAKIDAWRSLAIATQQNKWQFPALQASASLIFTSTGLYHPLLAQPVAYDTDFSNGKNFMLLTGANMSGKTTFMRSLGVGALMAHLGCGVPAQSMRISFMQSVITNMHVEDNIMSGESYFFAEVQRMKSTAQKIQQSGPHLVLMDELFKGTNVHDAYECTRAVVEGLLHRPGHIMVLSTHLYEVAQHFTDRTDIIFNHFVTDLATDDSYTFTYQLKPGISDDRIGYRILQKEGVIDLLRSGK